MINIKQVIKKVCALGGRIRNDEEKWSEWRDEEEEEDSLIFSKFLATQAHGEAGRREKVV